MTVGRSLAKCCDMFPKHGIFHTLWDWSTYVFLRSRQVAYLNGTVLDGHTIRLFGQIWAVCMMKHVKMWLYLRET